MSTENILNFIKVSDRIATGGQPTGEQFRALQAQGYEAVINLAPSNAENHALPDEEHLVRSLGMQYHHIPIEWSSPQRKQFVEFSEALQALGGSKVLIHCAANFRVTAFYSLYAMKYDGWSVAQADSLIAKVWESRPDYRMDDVWRSFILDIRAET